MNHDEIDEEAIARANAAHDRAHGPPHLYDQKRIRPSFREDRIFAGKMLTDRKIAKYEKAGRYSNEYKEAMRKLMELKRLRDELNSQR